MAPDVVLYGGTFDPPHLGHVDTIRLVRERFPAARIVIVPAYSPAIASGDQKAGPVVPFKHRVEMCRRAFSRFPSVEVSELEATLPAPNYTVKTLAAFAQDVPSSRLGWVMGADQFRAFPQWHEPGRILSLAQIVVVPRGNDRLIGKDVAAVLQEIGAPLRSGGALPVVVLDAAPPPYASRLIREGLRKGDKKILEALPAEVAAYIENQRLYRDKE